MIKRYSPAELYDYVIDRLGPALLKQRLYKQARHSAELALQEKGFLSLSRWINIEETVILLATLSLTYGWGYRNFLDIQVVENDLVHPRLPDEFEGYRVLHLSDMHLDLDDKLGPKIASKLEGLDYDLAVMTGDFRNATRDTYDQAVSEAQTVLDVLAPKGDEKVYAILGNHDFVEIVKPLEDAGWKFLLNETEVIEHRGGKIHLAGVDDPHFYRTHDFRAVRDKIPEDDFTLLLCHSPESYEEACAMGFDLMLSGHTHGGQIRTPWGWAPVKVCDVPSHMLGGPWECDELQGYTSPGTGSCGVPLRFFCPPEITIHTFKKSRSSSG